MEVEVTAAAAVDAGPHRGIAAAIVETSQLFLKVIRPHRSAGIEFERLGVDARRHRPQATAEFPGDDVIEVCDPSRGGDNERGAREDQQTAPA